MLTATGILFVGAGGYWLFEGIIGGRDEGPIRSLWWAVVTASTVGYGDAYPETTAGRGVAVLLIVAMVTLILPMITALFTAKLVVDRDAFTHEEQEEIKSTLAATRRSWMSRRSSTSREQPASATTAITIPAGHRPEVALGDDLR